jgi:hypothetical protein
MRTFVTDDTALKARPARRLGSARKNPQQARAAERVRDWVRARFALGDDATVMVSEIACAVPGCPPIETVIAFWTDAARRHHYKVFKPLAEVIEDDLPPSWMKDALAELDVFGCPCC